MLVNYKKPNVLVIGLPRKKANGKPMTVKSIKIIPGVNKIDDEDWKECQKNNKVQYLLKEQFMIVEVKEEGTPGEAGEAADLAGMGAKDAIELVKKCLRIDLLEQWATEDERSTVQTAISKQIHKINNPEED